MVAKGSSLRDILRLAEAAQKAGDTERALSLYAQVLARAPNHARARNAVMKLRRASGAGAMLTQSDVDQVIALLNRGAYSAAADQTRVLIALAPREALLHNILGMALASDGSSRDAARAFQSALRINPDYAEAHGNLGSALVQLEQYDKARPSLLRAIALNPKLAEALNNLALVLHREGALAEALKYADKALALRPDYANALNTKGIILVDMDQNDAAIDCFRAGLKIAPRDGELTLNYGSALDRAGDIDGAIRVYRQAGDVEAIAPEAAFRLGDLFGRTGENDHAIEAFNRSIRLDPSMDKSCRNLSVIKRFVPGDPLISQMEARINDPRATDETRMQLGFALGKALEDCGDFKAAFEYLRTGNREKRKIVDPYSTQKQRKLVGRIKSVFTPDFIQSLAPVAIRDKTPIFIIGMNRSGTTLVEQILASHSQVFGAGELEYLDMFGQANIETMDKLPLESFRSFAHTYVENLRALASGQPRVSDKLPANFHWVGLIAALFPNASIINLGRDPRDNCLSIWRNFFASSGNQYAYDLVELGEYYVLYRQLMEHWQALFPGRIHTLSYESLTADQERESRALLARCGLEWEAGVLAFHKTRRQVHTASVGQVRQKMYRSSVQSWKRFERELEPLFGVLERAGYLPQDD
ncbi:MAG: sulfotransferase [Paracoccaceae bacterium]